jgi:hypothetical protein
MDVEPARALMHLSRARHRAGGAGLVSEGTFEIAGSEGACVTLPEEAHADAIDRRSPVP